MVRQEQKTFTDFAASEAHNRMLIAEHTRAINMAMDRLRIATDITGRKFDEEDTMPYKLVPPDLESLSGRIDSAIDQTKQVKLPEWDDAKKRHWSGWSFKK